MRTLTQYEVAWNMYQAQTNINQIVATVSRHRATIYRWLARIKRLGIKEFLRRKKACKARRPRARIPETTIQKILDIRAEHGWCGQKIRKELKEKHGTQIGLSTIYRWLHQRCTRAVVGVRKYHKHQAIVVATRPREVVEHDTVDLGGLYAYTAIDLFTKHPSVYIGLDLEMATGAAAFNYHQAYYGLVDTHQSDNGSEFQSEFVAAVVASGARHRYSRPYRKNEQAHIENFNKALRSECLGKIHYLPSQREEVQNQVEAFVRYYLAERWHMGLPDMMTPQQFEDWYRRDPEAATLALQRVYD